MPSIARPCEWFFGRGPRAGTTSSGTSSRRTRSAVRISRRSGATGSTIRGRVDPSEVARSSSSGSSAAASSSSAATPATGGRTQPTSSGSSSDSRRSATDPSEELRSGELDVAMGVPPAVVPAVRRLPGVRLVTGAATNFEHLAIQLGPNAHPALRNKLVRRALAYGIDRTALVRQIWGEVDPSARVLNSAVHLTQSRYYEPNWRAYRYRPAEARRLLEQAGCRRGADGIFSCGGKRLSLRFVTTAGVCDPSAGASPDTGAASGCRGRGRAGVRSPRGVLRPDPPAGDVRRRTLLVGRLTGCIVGPCLRLRRAAELHRLLPAARHRPPQPGRQDPRRASTRPCPQQSRPGARE